MNYVGQSFYSMQCGHECISMITGELIQEICKNFQNNWSLSLRGDIMFLSEF